MPDSFGRGVRLGLPYAAAGFVLAVSFGVLARQAGFTVAQALVMSLIVWSGSAQFAATSIVAQGGGPLAAFAAASLANSRFLPMGIAFAPSLPGGPLQRAAQGQAVVDSSWALASRGDGSFDRWQLFGASAPQYVTWSAGTAVGALIGTGLGDTDRFGFDAIFPTFFLALLLAELRDPKARGVALTGGAIAVALVPFTPIGVPVLVASTAALIGLRR